MEDVGNALRELAPGFHARPSEVTEIIQGQRFSGHTAYNINEVIVHTGRNGERCRTIQTETTEDATRLVEDLKGWVNSYRPDSQIRMKTLVRWFSTEVLEEELTRRRVK
jgi:hypothetical protein